MTGALILGISGLEVTPVITKEYDDGVFIQLQGLKRVRNPPQPFIKTLDHAIVSAQVALGAAPERREIWRHPAICVALAVSIWCRVVVHMISGGAAQ